MTWGSGAKRMVMAAGMVHGTCVGEDGGARNTVFFPCNLAAAGDEGQLVWAVSLCKAPCKSLLCVRPAARKSWLCANTFCL